MGQELYATQPLFRQTLDRCAELLAGQMEAPLLQVLGYGQAAENDADAIDCTENAQPALFALEYALATLWLSWGGKPDLLLGHSVGEIAAACIAGVFSLEDGLKLAAARGRLMGALPQGGVMVAVQSDEGRVRQLLAAYTAEQGKAAALSIAAVNGPTSVVLSGESTAVQAVVERLEGVKSQRLKVSHAFHSPLMEPMLQAFQEVAANIRYSPPRMRMVSAVTGKVAGKEMAGPDYWVRHVVEAVRFADGVATLQELGAQIFLEIGPKPVLLGMAGGDSGQWSVASGQWGTGGSGQEAERTALLPSLRPGQSEWQTVLTSLGELYVQGAAVDWEGFDRGYARRKVVLPTYPFQRQRYWAVQSPLSPPAKMAQTHTATVANWLDTQALEHLATKLVEQAGLAGLAESVESRLLSALRTVHSQQQLQDQLDRLFYSVDWIRQAQPAVAAPATAGRWLLLADQQGVGDALAALLAAYGEQVRCVYASRDMDTRIDELLAQLAAPGTHPWRGVLHLWSLDANDLPADVEALQTLLEQTLASVLRVVQQLAAEQETNHVVGRLWLVTQGAQQLAEGEPLAVAQSPLWGLGKVVALEHPEFFGGLVDLDPGAEVEASARALLQEIGAGWQPHASDEVCETQLAWRQGERYVARLIRLSAEKLRPAARLVIHPGATYLVTGGLGALGLHVAEWLAGQGATHLVLTGRRGATTEVQRAVLERLAAEGVEVQIAQLDVADPAAMQRLFEGLKAAGDVGRPLRGVMHVAGVLDDGILLNQSWARFEKVLSAKIQGSWLLHTLTQGMALDFMVFFSSVASLLGNPGQGAYAAGNAFLDGLARSRQQQGLPGLSLNWGAWAGEEERDGGMATRTAAVQRRLDAAQFMSPQLALLALEQLLSRSGQYGVARIDWSRLNSQQAFPFLANFVLPETRLAPLSAWQQQLAALPASRRLEHLQRSLQEMVGPILGMAEPPSIARGFTDLGMDSLMAMELRRELERASACKIPATVVFEYPSIAALAEYLLNELLVPSPAEASEPAPEQSRSPAEPIPAINPAINPADPIAVISMACRFPGADSPEAFWEILCSLQDRVRTIPAERWEVDAFYDPQRPKAGKMYTRAGTFLDQVDQFDPLFFGISPREAASIDPQHRLLLEVSWEVLERGGLAQHTLVDSRTGVFVGIGESDYALAARLHDLSSLEPHQATGVGHSIAAGRLAYTLGLQGPTLAVDTACSSALVALHLACQSLRSRECDLALAGAASLILAPAAYVALSQMQALSPDGRCKTFDETADGYGRGEGGAMVLLKRLADAEADGDTVLAVIRGSAVNHDGPSSGLTVPNKRAQEKLLASALASAQVEADEVSYIEAHGTGTLLGDPIELRAIDAVFGQPRPYPLYVGSVKTHIGHLEAAAGIAGFVKTVLALQHGQIPPHLHLTHPTSHLDWEQMVVRVPTALQAWPAERRVAGVSAFGLSGTNAHLILEAAPARAPAQPSAGRPYRLLPLSLRDPAALPELAARYLEMLETAPDLDALCYTAAVGRNHFAKRVALVAPDQNTLEGQLKALAYGKVADGIVQGKAGHYAPRMALLFSGQGAQYAGMGLELYRSEPLFQQTLERCAALLEGQLDRPLLEILADPTAIHQTACTQPALFALEYSLAMLWLSWGIQPELLLGHSVGELAAACVAGVFSLEDGLRLVAERGRLMGSLPQEGEMVALPVSEVRAREAIAAVYVVGRSQIPLVNEEAARAEVAIAAVNGPQSVVIAGRRAAVQKVVQRLAAEGVKGKTLQVSHAFHSPLMEPILAEFAAVARRVRYHPPVLRLVSNVTGQLAGDEIATPEYWVRHLRETVQFAAGVATLHAQGIEIFLEIGPKPVLLGMAGECLDASRPLPALLPSLRSGVSEEKQLIETLGALYVRGAAIDWQTFTPPANRQRILLPTYPFQRQRFWLEPAEPASPVAAARPSGTIRQNEPESAKNSAAPQQQKELIHSLQQTLARILRLENTQLLEPQQNLLELGLDSLLAFEARNQLSALLGRELPATLLYDYPPIEKLAAYLTPVGGFAARESAAKTAQKPSHSARRLARGHSAVVALQPHGTKPPLFCLPPIAGTVQPYAQLAARLGPEQPVYGLQAVGVEKDLTPLTDLREIAAYFIAALQSVQPQGPYYLCGWSFGIFPAFEMAQQLHRHGERVALLAALDQEMLPGNKLERLWSGTRFLFTTGLPNLWPYLSDVFQSAGRTQAAPLTPQLNALRTAVGMRLLRVMMANGQALTDYQPHGYPGSLVLFQTRALRQRLLQDPTAGWGKYVRGGVSRHDIPGHHMNLLLAPQVAGVAEKMQQVLQACQSSQP